MSIEQVCFNIKRGNTWSRTIYIEDGDGNAINITGWEIRFTAKAKIDDVDVDSIFSIIATISNPIAGEAGLSLSSANTTHPVGSYLFDIQVKTNLGQITTVLEGILNILARVTLTN